MAVLHIQAAGASFDILIEVSVNICAVDQNFIRLAVIGSKHDAKRIKVRLKCSELDLIKKTWCFWLIHQYLCIIVGNLPFQNVMTPILISVIFFFNGGQWGRARIDVAANQDIMVPSLHSGF